METEGSLPCWQQPVHYPTHEPDQFSQRPHPVSWRSILILSSHVRLGLPSGIFPSRFLTEALYTLLFSQFVPHAQRLSFFIWSPGQYLMWSTNCEVSQCANVTQHASVRLCARACVGVSGCVLTARKKATSNVESHQSSHTAQCHAALCSLAVLDVEVCSVDATATRVFSPFTSCSKTHEQHPKELRLTRRSCSFRRREVFNIIFVWGWEVRWSRRVPSSLPGGRFHRFCHHCRTNFTLISLFFKSLRVRWQIFSNLMCRW